MPTVNHGVPGSSPGGGAILDRRSFLTSFLFLFFCKTLLANIIDSISGVKMWLHLSKLKSSNFSLKMQPRIFFLVFPSALSQYWLRFSIIGRVLLRYSLKGLLLDFNLVNSDCLCSSSDFMELSNS
jgi:hypothetical protein